MLSRRFFLKGLAAVLGGTAAGIKPFTPKLAATLVLKQQAYLDEVMRITLARFMPRLRDNIVRPNIFLTHLQRHGRVEIDGGKQISIPRMYKD